MSGDTITSNEGSASELGPSWRFYGVERIAALSDGVFAIVATLLVLDVKLPKPPLPGREISDELFANIPALTGWLVSFIILGRFWVVHHHLLARMDKAKTSTLIINWIFLGTIAFLPFAAFLLGTYKFDPLAITLFSASFGLSALALGVLIRHVLTEPSLLAGPAHDLTWHWRHHAIVLPLLSAIAAAASFLHPAVALAIWITEGAFVAISIAVKQDR